MAIATVVTRGFGNGTFAGSIGLIVSRGYALGAPVTPPPEPPPTPPAQSSGGGGGGPRWDWDPKKHKKKKRDEEDRDERWVSTLVAEQRAIEDQMDGAILMHFYA